MTKKEIRYYNNIAKDMLLDRDTPDIFERIAKAGNAHAAERVLRDARDRQKWGWADRCR